MNANNDDEKFAALLKAAYSAAQIAAKAEDDRLPPEALRGFDCGFAWVDIPTGRNAPPLVKEFVRWCSKQTAGTAGSKRGYGKAAWQFWSSTHAVTQSVSAHMAGAQAFALVLRNAGIEGAAAGSRLD